jgi:hypothetical protein
LWLSCFPPRNFLCYAPGVLLETELKSVVGKRRVISIVFLLLFGLFPLLNSLGNPRIKGLHGSDVMQLIASGLCFGAGFGIMIGSRRFPGK